MKLASLLERKTTAESIEIGEKAKNRLFTKRMRPLHWPAGLQGQTWIYWLWMASSLIVLLLAGVMSVGEGRTVRMPGLGVLPETCTLHAQLGIDCPGCGLTRTFIHLAHGRIANAWRLNPVGLLLFAFVVSQFPLALCMTIARSKVNSIVDTHRVGRELDPQQQSPQVGTISTAEPPLWSTKPTDRNSLPTWLDRWLYWNQWLLLVLMLALLLQWCARLTTGGLLG